MTDTPVKRVVLIGAESTGKTTLAQALAQRWDTEWVAEYGREHWEDKLRRRTSLEQALSWSSDEFVDIAREQQARENTAALRARRVLFADTNAFATGTWHERYYGRRDSRVDAIGAQDRPDLYLLTAPDVPFVQDGVRDGEHIRHWMHQRFVEQLAERPTPVVLIDGAYAERVIKAETAVKLLLDMLPA